MKTANFLILAGLASTMLVACSKPPPPPPPPPPKHVTPPPPEPITVEPLISAAKPDARVQFPQERAPVDESLAKAVISFADAFAKADSAKLGGMMDPVTKQVLDQLASSGALEDETKKAEAIRVVHLSEQNLTDRSAAAATFVLAIQEPGSSYVLAWTVTNNNGTWTFSAAPSTGGTHPRASEWDGQDFGAYGPNVTVAPTVAEPAPADSSGSSAPADPGGETKKEEPKAPSGDKTVRTPHGPIKVPGGG